MEEIEIVVEHERKDPTENKSKPTIRKVIAHFHAASPYITR